MILLSLGEFLFFFDTLLPKLGIARQNYSNVIWKGDKRLKPRWWSSRANENVQRYWELMMRKWLGISLLLAILSAQTSMKH